MATKAATAARAKKEIKIADEVFLYFWAECEWVTSILGVAPMGSTLEEHTRHLWDERSAVLQRAFKGRLASERIPTQAHLRNNTETDEGAGTIEVEVMEPEALRAVQAEHERLLERVKQDPHMDRYTRKMFEKLKMDPEEQLVRRIQRSINTFYRNPNDGNFVSRNLWFKGCAKSAFRDFLGMHNDQANRVARNVTIYPPFIDLGVGEPDEVVDANVPLQGGGRGDAQATIKRFHMVDPRKHGAERFSLMFQILNAAVTGDIVAHFGKLLEAMGGIGVGGSRPEFGVFESLEFKRLSYEEGKRMMREMRKLPVAVLPMAA